MALNTAHVAAAAVATVAAFALGPLASTAQAQTLAGSQVTAAGYCCAAPTEANRVTNAVTRVVGPMDEFPEGTFTSLSTGLEAVPAVIDVGSTTIQITYTGTGTASAGGFNGFVFSFAGAPAIAGVSLDPTSTYAPTVTFDASTVYVNEAGLALTPASNLLVNVTLVPEPESYALLLGGLGMLGVLARRRRG